MRACASALAFLCVASCTARPPPDAQLDEVSLGRFAMGTVLEMTAYVADPESGRRALERAFEEIRQLDTQLSRHMEESEISRLNRSKGTPFRLAAPAREALEISLQEGVRSGGAFDVTVGPLVALWTGAARRDRLPGESEVRQALGQVGAQHVHLLPGGRVALDPGTCSGVDAGGAGGGQERGPAVAGGVCAM